MVETIATYWEKQIKIYGVSERPNLGLLRFTFPAADTSELGHLLMETEAACGRFELVSAQAAGPGCFLLNLVAARQETAMLSDILAAVVVDRWQAELEIISPVAAIYFHGPHFQERFGIAHAVEKALAPHDLSMFFCGCAGTSIYLVIPEKERERTGTIIKEHFMIPDGR